MGDQRHQELDHQPRRRRLLHLLRGHRPRDRADDARSWSRPTGPGFSVGKLEHKLGIRASPTGQPIFEEVRVPEENVIGEVGKGPVGRARHARAHPPRRRRAGRRDRPGRDRLRRRLRARAPAVRQGDQRVPGDPVQARRHGNAHRRRPRAALQGVRDGRPAATRSARSTPRWRRCSARTRRWP